MRIPLMMAWKIEKWLAAVFPGPDSIYSAYRQLPRRELAIVAAASLDLALAELIAQRLVDFPKECEQFLGADEDGRAPAGSFGARIQLALLLGIITPADCEQLRIIKAIRNKFAHKVQIDFTSPSVRPLVHALYDKVIIRTESLKKDGHLPPGVSTSDFDMKPYFEMTPEAGAGLLLSVFCIYQAYFHRLSSMVARLEPIRCPHVSMTLSSKRPESASDS